MMIIVPAGEFVMGSSDIPDEAPAHQVSIGRAFAISRFEVTFEDWDACVTLAAGVGQGRVVHRGRSDYRQSGRAGAALIAPVTTSDSA